MHRRWMAGLRFEQAAHHIVLEDCIAAVEAATARPFGSPYRGGASGLVAGPSGARQALRGMALVAAATVVAELGDITRFANPRQLMAYLGPVPSEHSSGATRRQGGITKAGNGAANGGYLALSAPGTHQPRATAAPGGSGQADPRHRMEGARTAVSALSQALPGGKITHCGHDRDRSRTGGGFAWAIAKHVQIAGA
jgi:hypothetical protein